MLKTFKPFLLGFTIECTGLPSGVSCATAHQTLVLVDCNLVAIISLSLLLSPQQDGDRHPACNFYEINLFSKTFFPFTLYGCLACKSVCLCTTCMTGAHGGQKVLDPLELELQMFVSCHRGLGIELGSSAGSKYS